MFIREIVRLREDFLYRIWVWAPASAVRVIVGVFFVEVFLLGVWVVKVSRFV